MSLSIYTITTIVVTFVNARYFNSEDSTKTFVIIINSVYYGVKSIIVGIKLERDGLIYNKDNDLIIISPIIIGIVIAILLGIFVVSPTITISFVNVGLEMSKFAILLIGR